MTCKSLPLVISPPPSLTPASYSRCEPFGCFWMELRGRVVATFLNAIVWGFVNNAGFCVVMLMPMLII